MTGEKRGKGGRVEVQVGDRPGGGAFGTDL